MQAGFVASIHLCGASDSESDTLYRTSCRLDTVPAGNERAYSITSLIYLVFALAFHNSPLCPLKTVSDCNII